MRVRCPACRIERMCCYFCRQCDTRSVRMPIQTTSCSRRTFPVTSLSIKFVATFNSLGSLRMCRLRSAMADQVRVICNCLRSSSFLPCASICVRARCFVLRTKRTHCCAAPLCWLPFVAGTALITYATSESVKKAVVAFKQVLEQSNSMGPSDSSRITGLSGLA